MNKQEKYVALSLDDVSFLEKKKRFEVLGLIINLIGFALFLYLFWGRKNVFFKADLLGCMSLIIFLIFFTGAFFFLRRLIQIKKDIKDGMKKVFTTKLDDRKEEIQTFRGMQNHYYYFFFDEKKHIVTKDLFHKFTIGDVVTVYMSIHSKHIINVEITD